MRYDVFVSYSQVGDRELAGHVQNALGRFAKPWWRRRALAVFRDESSLSANPGLWSSIAAAIDQSRYFLLLASPEAASSTWVEREVQHWRAQHGSEGMLVAVTGGEIVWSDAQNDFDWKATTALGAACAGMFSEAPRYVDMRWARTDPGLDLSNVRFRDAIVQLAAPVRGMRREELVDAEARQYRRTMRQALAAGIAFVVLSVAAVGAFVIAAQKTTEANSAAAERDSAIAAANTANDERDSAVSERDEAKQAADAANREKAQAEGERDAAVDARDDAQADTEQANHERDDATDQATASKKEAAFGGYLAGLQRSTAITRTLLADSDATLSQGLSDTALLLAAQAAAHSTRMGGLVAEADVRSALLNALRAPGPVRILRAQRGPMSGVAISPNGERAAGIVFGTEVNVWRVSDGRILDTFPVDRETYDVRFIDANTLVVYGIPLFVYKANGDGTIWRLHSRQPSFAGQVLGISTTPTRMLVMSQTGGYDVDRAVRYQVFDSDGARMGCVRLGPYGVPVLAPSGAKYAVAAKGRLIVDPVGCRRQRRVIPVDDPSDSVVDLRFSLDERHVTELLPGTRPLIRADLVTRTSRVLPGAHDTYWSRVVPYPDGAILLTPDSNGIIQRVNNDTIGIGFRGAGGSFVDGLQVPGDDDSFEAVGVASNGNFVVGTGSEGTVSVFDLHELRQSRNRRFATMHRFPSTQPCVERVNRPCAVTAELAPDGSALAQFVIDGPNIALEVRTRASGWQPTRMQYGHLPPRVVFDGYSDNPVSVLAFDATGRVLAVANRDGSVDLFDVSTGRPLMTLPSRRAVFQGQYATVKLAFSGSLDRGRIVELRDGTFGSAVAQTWVFEAGICSPMAVRIVPNPALDMAIDSAGTRLVVLTDESSNAETTPTEVAHVYDAVAGGWREHSVFQVSRDSLITSALSPNGGQFVVGDVGGIASYDVDTGRPQWRVGSDDWDPWFATDGSLVTTAGGGVVRVRSGVDGHEELRFQAEALKAASGPVVLSQGRLMAVASARLRQIALVEFDLTVPDLIASACRAAGRNLTRSEWAQYVGSDPYERTCPQYPPGE